MAKSKTKGLKRLVVLDSHAILHRAYHAIPDFSTSKGEPTGALYGLSAMLISIVEKLKPDYVVATRDLPGKTHRHEKFDAYKGTRRDLEPELISQLERAPMVFKAFRIPVYEAPGYEADDAIGTIVKEVADREDIETIIASGDMDTLQLVGPRVSVYTLRKGLNDTVLYDEEAVMARYGFGPKSVIDYKGLRGDPSDNIPGIKGVGEKTATELIQKFGSIEEMYAAIEKNPEALSEAGVKGKMAEKILGGKKEALFSKELATIYDGTPIHFEIPSNEWSLEAAASSIGDLCDELEFKSLKGRVSALLGGKKKVDDEGSTMQLSLGSSTESSSVLPDAHQLEETALALWLLRSDYLSPTIEDIYAYAEVKDFTKARDKIVGDLKKTPRLQEVYDTIEHPLIAVVHRMDEAGIVVDSAYLKKLEKEYSSELEKISARIFKAAGHEFNINSPKQLGVVLYDEMGLGGTKTKKTATGARTTREDELQKMSDDHPIIPDILSHRELQKLLSTYVEKMPELVASDGRIHPRFLQAGSATGRMACENPNLQNIPVKTEYGRRIRGAFTAQKGYVLAAMDYSQIELRVAAGLSGDEKLCAIFRDGGDIHSAVASQVFGVPEDKVDREMRRRAKVINFGILYGMGVNALRENLGAGVTRDDASKFLDDYFKNFQGLAHWIEDTKHGAEKNGYTETLYGRRRYFPGLKSSMPQLRAQAERMAVNAPIQGTQSDIIKLAMVEADKLIEKNGWRDKARLELQVHDELIYEVAEDDAEGIARAIREVMEKVAPEERLHNVPIRAEIALGTNWDNLKKIS